MLTVEHYIDIDMTTICGGIGSARSNVEPLDDLATHLMYCTEVFLSRLASTEDV